MSQYDDRPDFVCKVGETHTPLELRAQDDNLNYVGFDVGTTVQFVMKPRRRSSSLVVNAPATIVGPGVASTHIDYGRLRYEWEPADVDQEGDYLGHFVITWPDGTTSKFPNDDETDASLLIRINPDLT